MAVEYLKYLGTSKYAPAQLQEEFYKLGCSFSVFSSEDEIYVSLSGLNENFDKAVTLFESLLADAQPNDDALANLKQDVLKKREDAKLSKDEILWNAMYNYGVYGSKSPFTNIMNRTELNAVTSGELCKIIKSITGYNHHVLYYGPTGADALVISLNQLHQTVAQLKPVPAATKFAELNTDKNKNLINPFNLLNNI